MELRGCSGCSGFSYTDKYKKSIVDFYTWITKNRDLGIIKYQEAQELIESEGICKNSETRMIVPFLIKVGVINKNVCKFNGSRLSALNTVDLFTKSGESFIQFLKIEMNRDLVENMHIKIHIQNIFEKFAMIQFHHLFNSDEEIYRQMVKYLIKYKTINKIEFFILTTILENGKYELLDEKIQDYRNGKYKDEEFIIEYNQNAYSYISKLLLQYKLFYERDKNILLNEGYIIYFQSLIDNQEMNLNMIEKLIELNY